MGGGSNLNSGGRRVSSSEPDKDPLPSWTEAVIVCAAWGALNFWFFWQVGKWLAARAAG